MSTFLLSPLSPTVTNTVVIKEDVTGHHTVDDAINAAANVWEISVSSPSASSCHHVTPATEHCSWRHRLGITAILSSQNRNRLLTTYTHACTHTIHTCTYADHTHTHARECIEAPQCHTTPACPCILWRKEGTKLLCSWLAVYLSTFRSEVDTRGINKPNHAFSRCLRWENDL